MQFSTYLQGKECGFRGDRIPEGVPVLSDFAEGWRVGRDLRHEMPRITYTDEPRAAAECGGWPQTWPEGCEGAAAMIPGMAPRPIKVAVPCLSPTEIADIRIVGGPVADLHEWDLSWS